MASSPRITVLIPTFNRAEYLAECLDSILNQTLAASQILVVDDGSTDSTREVLKPYRDRIDSFETAQLGKPGALNRGLEKVTGDYLWIFDDDDVALPDALERFARPLERQPAHGFSFSTFFFTASEPKSHRLGAVRSALEIPELESRGFLVPLLEANFLGGAALFARTACYRQVGNFDATLLRSQDYDMAIRIARRFTGVRVSGGPTFHYRQHGGARGNTRDRFAARFRMMKWLEYDQMIFRRLYKELELSEYLPSGPRPVDDRLRRQALLQRLTIMANKLLMSEVMNDLGELARLDDRSPFSGQERDILKVMVGSRYQRMANPLDHGEFPAALRRLSDTSSVVRSLRREILNAIFRRLRERPGLWRIFESISRSLRLCR